MRIHISQRVITGSRHVFRAAIGLLFGYFGIQAVLSPTESAAIWIRPEFSQPITAVLPLASFMVVLGVAQILVAFSLVTGLMARFGLLLAAALLLGIIVNLGWNEISFRDAVIFTGTIYLLLQAWRRA